jgi:hypothetical protein
MVRLAEIGADVTSRRHRALPQYNKAVAKGEKPLLLLICDIGWLTQWLENAAGA